VGNYMQYNAGDLQTLGFPTTLTVAPAQQGQTIAFGPLPNQVFGTPPFTVSATASFGLPVSFCFNHSNHLHRIGRDRNAGGRGHLHDPSNAGRQRHLRAGSAREPELPGDAREPDHYLRATLESGNRRPPFTVGATASSGLPVSFDSRTARVCAVSGTAVAPSAAGACTIQATQRGDADWAAALPVDQSFQVTQ
jgi:hypothetical protein